jgi:ABC-2 type transport system ATP-binding protein
LFSWATVPFTTPSLPGSAEPAVEVRGLVKRYGTVEALRGIDLTVAPGEMLALLGPNGAGKTTLFSILATLRTPTAGAARVLGCDVVTERDAVRRKLGIVFQEPAIEQRLTGRDNLLLMGLFYGLPRRVAKRRAADILAGLDLAEAADRPAKSLSGGQRRKLELARALVTDPGILFLDEATLGLDVDARRGFWTQVRALAASGRTVFFTTHYMEEAEVADRIALIDAGRIVALDTPGALKARLGGGVIRLQTDDDAQAAAWLTERGYAPGPGASGLMMVHADPAGVMPEILRALPVKVRRVEMTAPSLEDVFLKLTGRGLDGQASAPAGSPVGANGNERGGPS